MYTAVRRMGLDRFLGTLGAVLVVSTLLLTAAACSKAEHAVALKAVSVLPDDKQITAGSTSEVATGEDIEFAVTVENRGSKDERDVRVMITLVSATTPQQQMTVCVSSLRAKDETTVLVQGLHPTTPGEEATLTVEVGPVVDEGDVDDNSLTASLMFVQ